MDLAEWYAAGRWVGLLDLIDGLPAASRLNEAIVNDPEAAAVIAKMPKPSTPWSPRVAEFDLKAHLLRELLHAVQHNGQIAIGAAGGRPGEVKPFPVPRTEVDRAIAALERQWAESFVTQFGFDATDI
ncbi:hypothetical protein [Pseudarthrobacter polychromogenes]|uniref:Uncharacterized protein n=1 Tax=Pseudarthrobacter polychromogenes TaxID=1676 RepID=A0ABQ1Y3K9_9MICC|nr:hypothetical protein [Pseudarthrobacter polychromogenes]GGH10458.1 hypothetical protein GCM10011577_39280 [Pseudarthrobacter polychromogenes]